MIYAFLVAFKVVVVGWLFSSLKRFLNINYEYMMNDWNQKKRSPPFVPVSRWSSLLVVKKYSWFASLLALAYLFPLTTKSDVGLLCNNNKYTYCIRICIMITKVLKTLLNQIFRMINTTNKLLIWFDYKKNDLEIVNGI